MIEGSFNSNNTPQNLAFGVLKEGKSSSRHQLGKEGNPVLKVASKSIEEFDKATGIKRFINSHLYVKVKGDVYVNIRSLAKRLGISNTEVRKLAKADGDFSRIATRREKVISKYSEIAKKYTEERGNLKAGDTRTKLTAKILLKICDVSTDEKGEFIGGKYSTTFGRKFFVAKDAKIFISDSKLGEGGYGKVFKAKMLDHSGNMATLKNVALKESIKEGVSSLKTENNILKELHKTTLPDENPAEENPPENEEPVEGIQSELSEVTHIGGESGKEGFYHMELMSGDLKGCQTSDNFHDKKAGERLGLCLPLLKGLAHIHNKGYVHRDIKPENCLMKMKEDGQGVEKFVIGDFGLAKKKEELTNTSSISGTTDYIPSDSFKDREAGDVFAMSVTLIQLLANTFPNFKIGHTVDRVRSNGERVVSTYPRPLNANDQNDSEAIEDIKENLKCSGIPESIANLLLQGIGPVESRPTAKKLMSKFSEALKAMTSQEINAPNTRFIEDVNYM